MAWDAFNPIRLAGDLSHLTAKCILIWAIHRNRSAEGVSLITQVLYATVFFARYLDLPWESSTWNFLFKIIYITTSCYTIGAMRFMFPRTRERETAWKLGAAAFVGALVASPFVMWIFERRSWGFLTLMWVFSQILESVAVLPQLLLLRQTTVPTVIDSFYLVALGSYRALYLINWFVRGLEMHGYPPDPVSVIFGIVQTVLYVDFAWVYYTRQRVKLRDGGIVDADDIRRGWIIGRIFGRVAGDDDDDEEAQRPGNSTARRPNRAKWGARGVSVSADDDVLNTDHDNSQQAEGEGADPDARMRDPDELARVLDEDDSDEDGPSSSSRPLNSESRP